MAEAEGNVEATEQTAPPATGLLDGAVMEREAVEEIDEGQTTVNHLSEEAAPVPDGVPAKFVKDNVVDVGGLAKSYTELETKFRAGLHKAPEDGYDLAVATAAGVAEDDPVLKVYADWAKDAGISQEHFNQLAGQVLANGTAAAEADKFSLEAEMDSLGSNAQAVIDDQVEWAQKLVKTGTWGADDFEEFKVWGGTANGIRAIQKLRRYMGETTTIPTDVNPTADSLPSEEDCYAMVKDPRYRTEPAFRAKVEQTFARVFGSEPNDRVIM